MKIAKIKNSKDSELSLVIENDDDLIAWGNLRTEDKPFELTKSDLDKIENYLKGTFEC